MKACEKCYQLIDCPFNGKDPHESDCPVYAEETACWLFDWVSFYKAMAEGEDKKHWLHTMVDMCRECDVYQDHADEMEDILKSMIYSD